MDQSVEQAVQLMCESEVRRLIVLGSDDRPIGIVSLGDLATMTHDTPEVGETLEQIDSPSRSVSAEVRSPALPGGFPARVSQPG